MRSDATITIPACVRYMSRTFPCFTILSASTARSLFLQRFEPAEDLIRVYEVARGIHDRLELRFPEPLAHRLDLEQVIAEAAALLPGPHPGALDDPVRLLARGAGVDQ